MTEQTDILLRQLREGSFGASGYVTETIDALCREVLSETSDQVASRLIAKRLRMIMPAFKAGLAVRLLRTDT